jgi:hypothetical protein
MGVVQETCKGCGIKYSYDFYIGAKRKYCSDNCLKLAKNNSNRKYESRPENKLRKRILNQNRHAWIRYSPEYKLLSYARVRAKEKNLEFTITVNDIKIPKFCPLLDISLEVGTKYCQQNSPSLDRIDPRKGYTPDNIWVISFRANTIKCNCDINDLKILVEKLDQKLIEQKIQKSREDNNV